MFSSFARAVCPGESTIGELYNAAAHHVSGKRMLPTGDFWLWRNWPTVVTAGVTHALGIPDSRTRGQLKPDPERSYMRRIPIQKAL